jgi:hypothetical protein
MKIDEILNESKDPRSIFRTGLCDAMAIALHEITKLPLGVWRGTYIDDYDEEEAYEDCHMCVVVSFPQHKYLDVDGIHTDMPNCYFSNQITEVNLVPISRQEAIHTFTMEGVTVDDIEDAKSFIKNDPTLNNIISKIIQ